MKHADQINNHVLENWTYADATARTGATGFVSADIGKVAFQQDTKQYFRLTAITPTWQQITTTYSVDIQFFTANGTWTKPANAKLVYVICIGAAGGGGSGRRGAVSIIRLSGAGGNPGGWMEGWFPASVFGSSETITVGAGGTGAAVQTVDDTNGLPGNAGGNSSFGGWLTAKGGGGGPGGTVTAVNSAPAPPSMRPTGTGGSSFASAVTPTQGNIGGIFNYGAGLSFSGPGSSGGGISATNNPQSGISGGQSWGPTIANIGGASGGTAGLGGNGGNASDNPNWNTSRFPFYGAGGGGPASGDAAGTVAGGKGGNGGRPSGGGGGGGASTNGANSGGGGNGADGYVWIMTECYG
jgi:hypothetical protein